MKFPILYIVFVSLLLSNTIIAQTTPIEWDKCYGGTGDEGFGRTIQTADGGYLFIGSHSETCDGDVTYGYGGDDIWIVKTDSFGSIQWQKSYGGSNDDWEADIIKDINGGYIFASSTYSSDGGISLNHGEADYWIVRLDDTGKILWQKCYGGSNDELVSSIQQTSDSGYIIGGVTYSNDGDVVGKHADSDAYTLEPYEDLWVVKLDINGNLQWQKCLGGSNTEEGGATQQTPDGNYIVCGWTLSVDGDVTGMHADSSFHWISDGHGDSFYVYGAVSDAWLVKLNGEGHILWEKCYGGSAGDGFGQILQQSNGDLFIIGATTSYDGDVTGYHGGGSEHTDDTWIVVVDSSGNIKWEKCYGGSNEDNLLEAVENSSGFVLCGETASDDGDVSGFHLSSPGNNDVWVVQIDDTGKLLSQICLGGSGDDFAAGIVQTPDSEYILSGGTSSHDGDVHGKHITELSDDFFDAWVVKLNKELAGVPYIMAKSITVYPNPTTGIITISATSDVQYKVSDIYGRVFCTGAHMPQLDISTAPDGVYILEILDLSGRKLLTEKIVKE